MRKKLIVYTVSMGSIYGLPPTRPQDGVDYICFTDQQGLEPNGWTIRYVAPLIPSDSFRSSREYKVRPHRWLSDCPNSIYIDSTVHLHKDPLALWDHLIPNETNVFGGFFHSFRATIADEFSAVADAKLDWGHRIKEQLEDYRVYHAQTLNDKPVWGGVLARRHNTQVCIEVMEAWFAHILRYSRRDQLSLPLALSHLSSSQRHVISADIQESEFHKWPVSSQAKPSGYTVCEDSGPLHEGSTVIKIDESGNLEHRNIVQKRLARFRRSLEKRRLLPSQWL